MTDIVDELRYGHEAATLWHVAREAADTIEALRAENEKLRAALKPLADEVEYVPSRMDDDDWYEMDTIKVGHIRAAAAALKETGDE